MIFYNNIFTYFIIFYTITWLNIYTNVICQKIANIDLLIHQAQVLKVNSLLSVSLCVNYIVYLIFKKLTLASKWLVNQQLQGNGKYLLEEIIFIVTDV